MKAHASSDSHIQVNQVALAHLTTQHTGSVIQQLQNVVEQEGVLNRKAMKSFIHCAHFLARQHVPHTTNFDKLVELVVSCGGEALKNFMDRPGKNAVCSSHIASCGRVY